MRYYKTLTNAIKHTEKDELVVKFIGFDDFMDKQYRVMSYSDFCLYYKASGLYVVIYINL